MNQVSSLRVESQCCKLCGLADPDVRINPCSCEFHARCFPTSFFSAATDSSEDESQENKEFKCPSCNSNGETMYLEPLKLQDIPSYKLLRAVNRDSDPNNSIDTENREGFFLTLAPIFLLQSSANEIIIDEEAQIRNGRWTTEEIEFIDCLMTMFNKGALSIPNGISLNNFLRSIFLCKGTRLRKKIKNANFCTRLYNLNPNESNEADIVKLSKLQEKFFASLEADDDLDLLKFSMKRMWRTHFFNTCVQRGIKFVLAKDLLESIEHIEKEVIDARESKAVRERRQWANKTSSQERKKEEIPQVSPKATSYALGQQPMSKIHRTPNASLNACWDQHASPQHTSPQHGMPKPPGGLVPQEIQRSMDDLEVLSDVTDNDVSRPWKRTKMQTCSSPDFPDDADWNPFVQKFSQIIEDENWPFQYFDVWHASSKDEKKPVLRHVGHYTRSDIDCIWSLYHMNQFGKDSSHFQFVSGEGLPGRVFETGKAIWDDEIQNMNNKMFPRIAVARKRGVKKGLGIPMFHTSMGKVVIALYTCEDVPKDANLVEKCCNYFQNFSPSPRCELVVDIGKVGQENYNPHDDANTCDTENESEITNLLSKYASSSSTLARGFTSLRLLFLQPKSKLSVIDNSTREIINASYSNYIKSKQKEETIASLLVHEFTLISRSQGTNSSSFSSRPSSVSLELPSLNSEYDNSSAAGRYRSSSIHLSHNATSSFPTASPTTSNNQPDTSSSLPRTSASTIQLTHTNYAWNQPSC
mmetsp:Transcript_9519/g.11086  ORF Transcript_9519/g.11086 Transcript_9519/m.11086 type:complete len:754 (+) Transcript_9519:147-2408(+)